MTQGEEPMTIYEAIKQMTIDELSSFLENNLLLACEFCLTDDCNTDSCIKANKLWLQQEYETIERS